jgi:hypothetical protein
MPFDIHESIWELATSLIQSSSSTTSIVVGLVAGGVLNVASAIPMEVYHLKNGLLRGDSKIKSIFLIQYFKI